MGVACDSTARSSCKVCSDPPGEGRRGGGGVGKGRVLTVWRQRNSCSGDLKGEGHKDCTAEQDLRALALRHASQLWRLLVAPVALSSIRLRSLAGKLSDGSARRPTCPSQQVAVGCELKSDDAPCQRGKSCQNIESGVGAARKDGHERDEQMMAAIGCAGGGGMTLTLAHQLQRAVSEFAAAYPSSIMLPVEVQYAAGPNSLKMYLTDEL